MLHYSFWKNWDLTFRRRRDDLIISGSPNRSQERLAFETDSGEIFIAERFDLRKKSLLSARKKLLEHLSCNGLPEIFPALTAADGSAGAVHEGSFWQVRPWIDAALPERQDLGENLDLAEQWCNFLLRLKQISAAPEMVKVPGEMFTFKAYLPKLYDFAEKAMPELRKIIDDITGQVSDFIERESAMPAMLAHGDFHPGNILVRNGRIAAVIDWEFTGWKSAGYDLALLLGCLGMDNPEWLDGKVTRYMQDTLYQQDYMPHCSWQELVTLMTLIRLGWLREWIYQQDHLLIRQEISYIRLLLNHCRRH